MDKEKEDKKLDAGDVLVALCEETVRQRHLLNKMKGMVYLMAGLWSGFFIAKIINWVI